MIVQKRRTDGAAIRSRSAVFVLILRRIEHSRIKNNSSVYKF